MIHPASESDSICGWEIRLPLKTVFLKATIMANESTAVPETLFSDTGLESGIIFREPIFLWPGSRTQSCHVDRRLFLF